MNQIVQPGFRTGTVSIPASKSHAHRLLICAALGRAPVKIRCQGISKDIAATIACLNALGADITVSGDRIAVSPIAAVPAGLCHLPCGESGSTLRFLLPVAGALGAEAVFHMEGRLPQRPLRPLDEVLTVHGMTVRQEGDLLFCGGTSPRDINFLPGMKKFASANEFSDTVTFFDYDPENGKLTPDGHVLTHKRPLAIYWEK